VGERKDDRVTRRRITERFGNAPAAFIGLFEGENVGKRFVEVGKCGG
jgi:NADPH-dependent curcumin reductase CurA